MKRRSFVFNISTKEDGERAVTTLPCRVCDGAFRFFLVGCLVKMTSRRGVSRDRKPDKVGGRRQESSGDKPTGLFSTGCEFDLTVELSYFTVIGLKS